MSKVIKRLKKLLFKKIQEDLNPIFEKQFS